MQFSILSALAMALAGSIVTAIPTSDNAFTKRADPAAQDAAVQIVQDLFYEVTPYTANISEHAPSLIAPTLATYFFYIDHSTDALNQPTKP